MDTIKPYLQIKIAVVNNLMWQMMLFFFLFFFLCPHGMQDLSSPTRDWTHALWKHAVLTTGRPGKVADDVVLLELYYHSKQRDDAGCSDSVLPLWLLPPVEHWAANWARIFPCWYESFQSSIPLCNDNQQYSDLGLLWYYASLLKGGDMEQSTS